MNIIWTPGAHTELDDVYRFLARVNERAAAKIYNQILDMAASLAMHPRLGRIEPTLEHVPGNYRARIVGRKFKIIYQVGERIITISSVWDCRRNPASLTTLIK